MPTLMLEQAEGQDLKSAVDADIRKFEEWFQGLENDPLTGGEKAIISTYLWWKVKGTTDGSQAGR